MVYSCATCDAGVSLRRSTRQTGLTGNSRSKGFTFALSVSLKSVSNSCTVDIEEPRKPAK